MFTCLFTRMRLVILWVLVVPIASSGVLKTFYVNSGYTLIGGTVLQNFTEPELSIAGCARICLSECNCAVYSTSMRQCVTFSDRIYETTITWSRHPYWSVLYQHKEIRLVQHGNWTLVFRGQRDINQAVTDRWLSNNLQDDNPVPPSLAVHCYRLDTSISCPTHFRSHILDKWSDIDKVKFAIYEADTEVKSIIFNGTGTTRIDWFQKSRVLSSSWSSLANDTGIADFAFKSRQGPPQKRRFAINTYAGCKSDTTYFEIFDTAYDGCMTSYNLSLQTYPRFLYSPFDSRVRISAGPTVYKLADIVAVFVQFTAR